jgi:hypothetical protein
MAGQVRRPWYRDNFGFAVGVVIVVVAAAANVIKLVLNLVYWYMHANVAQTGVDPVTGFALGVGAIAAAGYLLVGLRKRSVWAAVGLMVMMPLLYVQMVDGLVAALAHQQMYFSEQELTSLFVEVLPAAVLALFYGVQALANYQQRFRRLR